MNTKDINQAYPRLETIHLVLRALRMEDADFIFKEWGDALVTHYMRDEEPLKTREQAEEMLRPLQTPEKMPNFKWWGDRNQGGRPPDRHLRVLQMGSATPPRGDWV
jgi:RimJ/RimL family protein N-acetyltransferase